jgi:hypothetical protein
MSKASGLRRLLLLLSLAVAVGILLDNARSVAAGAPVKSRAEAKAACVRGCLETTKRDGQLTPEEQRTYCDETCGCVTDALVSPDGKQSKHTRAEVEGLMNDCSERALDKISKKPKG